MRYKRRILRGPQRPSPFKSRLFYISLITLLSLIVLYQVTGEKILKELNRKDLSTHLLCTGEAVSHILYHQFFILGLQKEDVKHTLKKIEKDGVSWNLYQMEIIMPPHLTVQQAKASIEHEVTSSYPALSFKSRVLDSSTHELMIQENDLPVCQLTFFTPSAVKPGLIEPRPDIRGKIAIVIDDLGPNLALARQFLALDYQLTFSILPFYTYSKEIALEAHSRGREVMLHLPLEPLNNEGYKPEKGFLFILMDGEKLRDRLRENISAVPHIRGVNGHMGSKFTGDRRSMEIVLGELKNRGLFFLDSLTTGKSVGSSVAHDIGMQFSKRDLFLDRELAGKTIEERIIQLSELSKKRGHAIGIVHPYPDTVNALQKMLPLLLSEGVEVVPVSQVIKISS